MLQALESEWIVEGLFTTIFSIFSFRVDNQKMRNIVKFFSEPQTTMRAPVSKAALKFVEAARYGEIRKNVAKCEHRYQCSLPMEIIQELF